MTESIVEFDHVVRWFGTKPVLRDLNLRVARGEAVALLGRNGAGKTTALRILLGLLEPHAGSARVLGAAGGALTPRQREDIGFVPEGHVLPAALTVEQLIAFETATRARFDRTLVDRVLGRLGVTPRARVGTLSKGQKAQLSLVLATAGTPSVLVFDDPALGLDVVARRELLDALVDLLADRGVTLLFSSHFLTDVERVADRVAILHDGRLVADATLDDLRRRVSRRFLRPRDDLGTNGAALKGIPGVLRARRGGEGIDLTLLDADAATESMLRARAVALSEPQTIDLEQVFIDLTGPDSEPRVDPPSGVPR